jgi:hypothetical protein
MEVDETTDTVTDQPDTETVQVEDPEKALEDTDISFDDPAPEDEPDDPADDPEDKTEERDGKTEDEPEEPEDKTDAPKDEPSDEEKRKQHNREMAEKRLQAKAEREAQLKKQQDDYIAEATADDPRDLAVRQLQVDAYNNKVEINTGKLTNQYEKALKDFDVLNDSSPEIQAELNQALDAFQAIYVTFDKFNNPTDVRGDLYKYLQAKADSIAALTGRGARHQQQNKAKEKSKALTPPAREPKTPKKDPDLEAFDEEAAR